MRKSRFTAEFKADAVRMLKESGLPIGQVAKKLGVTAKSLRERARQANVDAGRGPAGVLTTAEKQEMSSLRREVREVKRERDFSVQAAAYFAKAKR